MSIPEATGHLRVIARGDKPSYYAQIRTVDGRRLTRKLGPVWSKRSRPPAGYLTHAEAERRLAAILAGEDADVQVVVPEGATFAQAAEEWLRWVEFDRCRERSTVLGYRHILDKRLLPTFGHLRLEDIDVRAAERWRMALVEEGLRPATINRHRWQADAIYKRAARVWDVPRNPFGALDRQPNRHSGDFAILAPEQTLALAERSG